MRHEYEVQQGVFRLGVALPDTAQDIKTYTIVSRAV